MGSGYDFLYAILILFGLFDFIYIVLWYKIPSKTPRSSSNDLLTDTTHQITIQIPVYNSQKEILPLLQSLQLYPNTPVHILDSSDDGVTPAVIQKFLQDPAHKESCQYFEHRVFEKKLGNKAWALNQTLSFIKTPYVAVFDHDFKMPQDFLPKVLDALNSNPDICFVQALWVSDPSLKGITAQIDALSVAAEQLVEDQVRSHYGFLFTIHGSAFAVKSDIVKRFKWQDEFLSEDVDLSCRLYLHGCKSLFLHDVSCVGEVCGNFCQFYRQKSRWIEGRSQVLREYFFKISISKKLGFIQKVFWLHYLGYFLRYPLILLLLILYVFGQKSFWPFLLVVLFLVTMKSTLNLASQRRLSFKTFVFSILEPVVFLVLSPQFSFRVIRGILMKHKGW